MQLTRRQMLVLSTIDVLAPYAYGANICRRIRRDTKIEYSTGSIHYVFQSLAKKGLITSKLSDPSPVKGGRRRRLFALTDSGRDELRHLLNLSIGDT